MFIRYVLIFFVLLVIVISITTFGYFNKLILTADISAFGAFLNFLGVVYAVIAAFVIFEAGGRFTGINEELSKEFMALRNVFSMAKLLKDKELIQFSKERIKDYSLILKEKLYINGPETKRQVSEKFRALFSILEKINPKNEVEKILTGHIVDALRTSANARSQRLGFIDSSIPPLEIFLIVFLSITLVFGFFLMRLSNIYLFTALMAIVSAAVSFIMVIILDLNSPFKGSWTISSQPIDHTIELLEAE